MLSEEINKECLIFCHNIKWMRSHRKLSKKRMAKMLGIGVVSLTKIENGIIPPRLNVDIFFRFQHCFGISPVEQLSRRLDETTLP